MSIIYSYPEQGALNANDMLIGTSAEKVGGKQKNITRNFTVQQIADFINRGAGFVDPVASDFQIPVFNQQGKKITGSIMSQNIYPNGSAITISGSLTVTNGATIGDFTNDIIFQSPTVLIGPIKDANSALSTGNQILLSTPSGNVVWQNYEAGLTYEGTWNASTNTPALTSGQGVSGHFYIVNVAGNTNLDGNNDWHVGDWAVFFDAGGAGTAGWQKIDNTSVLTGSGTANTFAMWTATETLNDSLLSQDAGATKVIVDGLLEIKGDGTSQDGRIKLNCWNNNHGVTIQSPPHSAAQSWTWILPQTTGGANDVLTTDGNTPSQLSWTTPTTGTVTGTGTENYVTKWSTGGTGIEDSTIFDNGTNVGIGTTSPVGKLYVGPTWSTYGGNDLYIKDTGVDISSYDPQVANTSDLGITYVTTSTNTSGPDKVGLTLFNNDDTAGTFSPMLLFAKREIPSSSYKATMAGIYARSPLGTGNNNTWIDGELIFATAGAASKGIKQRMVINKEGNVGIGTTSPDSKLHVYGAGTGSGTYGAEITIGKNNGPKISSTQEQTDDDYQGLAFFTKNSNPSSDPSTERLRIASNGNVGIGTSSPSQKLDVDGNIASNSIYLYDSTSNDRLVLDIDSSDNVQISTGTSAGSRAIGFQTEGTEKMRISDSGNVGIGTASPAVSLDISATDAVQMPAGVTGDRPTTGVSNGMLRYNSTNNGFEGYINGNWGSIGGGSSGGLVFRGTFNASTGDIAGGGNLTTGTNRVAIAIGDMYIVDTAGDFYGDTSKPLNVGDEVICVLDAAVGTSDINDWNAIASGSGGAVTGSGTTNYVPKFTGATVVGNSSIFNDASGNVGIGTSSPNRDLQIKKSNSGGHVRAEIFNTSNTANSNGVLSIYSGGSSAGDPFIHWKIDQVQDWSMGIDNSDSDKLKISKNFGLGVSDYLAIDTSGNVGIGTASPDTKLHVESTSNANSPILTIENDNAKQIELGVVRSIAGIQPNTSFLAYDNDFRFIAGAGSTNEVMRIDSNGKVGIGTEQPEVSLDLGSNTDAIRVPNGANADRPSGILPGMIRYNTSTNEFEGYSGTLNVSGSWGALGGGGVPTISKQLFQVTTATPTFVLNSPQVNPQDANYVNIFIDGVYQNSGTYTVATATGVTTVTLSTNAPVGTSVEIISTT